MNVTPKGEVERIQRLESELKHGRLAMLAVVYYSFSEAITDTAVSGDAGEVLGVLGSSRRRVVENGWWLAVCPIGLLVPPLMFLGSSVS